MSSFVKMALMTLRSSNAFLVKMLSANLAICVAMRIIAMIAGKDIILMAVIAVHAMILLRRIVLIAQLPLV